jgi:hypothetical protein
MKLDGRAVGVDLKRFRVFRTAVFLLLVVSSIAHPQDYCGSGKLRQARTASLRQSGIAVLNAIAQKNTEGLAGYVGRNGLAFGVDKYRLSRDELRTQFTHREGAYCLFFSTACIPEMGRFKGLESDEILSKWKISYIEWLQLNRAYTTYAELTDDGGATGCSGNFTANAGREMKNAPSEIELDFYFEDGKWWFVDTVDSVP